LKEKGLDLLVGDLVEIDRREKVIEKVYPRKNSLTRPQVANIDQVIILMSVSRPPLDLVLLDRLLVTAEKALLEIVIGLNKTDLLKGPEMDRVKEILGVFRNSGYRVILTSALTEQGVSELKNNLKGKVSVFAGPSGAGKSTFINKLKPGLGLLSEPVSSKTERGRHTTRHVELLKLADETFVADTPGFQRLNLEGIAAQELSSFFPEMSLHEPCRFNSCLHRAEPGCAVKDALQRGKIASWRYNHYLDFLEEIEQLEKKKY
jgi:ribosome biogenesis GTPase